MAQRKYDHRPAWTWPLVTLIVLVIAVAVGTVLALVFA